MVTAVNSDFAIRSRSVGARSRYIETAEQASRSLDAGAPDAILSRCVTWLELFHASALIWEYAYNHQIASVEELRHRSRDLDRHVRAAFPGFAAAEPAIQELARDLQSTDDVLRGRWPVRDWLQMVRSYRAVVAEFPIELLEDLGNAADGPALAYRARCAYDALRAFVRRHDPARAKIMQIVGERYQLGHISLADAAALLELQTSDAIFELEQDGRARSPEVIEMAESARAAIYARLRERRLRRAGSPDVDPELVERDVIASERIEGVDARAWIRRR